MSCRLTWIHEVTATSWPARNNESGTTKDGRGLAPDEPILDDGLEFRFGVGADAYGRGNDASGLVGYKHLMWEKRFAG